MKSKVAAAAVALSSCMLSDAFSLRPAELNAPVRDEPNHSRRAFLATGFAFAVMQPAASHATYGEDAKMLIPDIAQGIADRTNKQCLVEGLGIRDCLVYLDPDNQLYKGSDALVLFERLEGNVKALKDVPAYIESKQWNKVLGVLTGPMGTLSSTMNELTKISDDSVKSKCKSLSTDIRNDLYAISGAVDRKNVKDASAAYEKAAAKLEKFVALVSSS